MKKAFQFRQYERHPGDEIWSEKGWVFIHFKRQLRLKNCMGVSKVAQWIICLLNKPKDLSSEYQHPRKEVGM